MTYDVACPICGRIDRSLYPEKGVTMATSKDYLKYVLEQLSGLPEISHRAMMGEYVLYYRGKVIGGIYDDRLLLKPTKAAEKMLPDAERDIPYEGANCRNRRNVINKNWKWRRGACCENADLCDTPRGNGTE